MTPVRRGEIKKVGRKRSPVPHIKSLLACNAHPPLGLRRNFRNFGNFTLESKTLIAVKRRLTFNFERSALLTTSPSKGLEIRSFWWVKFCWLWILTTDLCNDSTLVLEVFYLKPEIISNSCWGSTPTSMHMIIVVQQTAADLVDLWLLLLLFLILPVRIPTVNVKEHAVLVSMLDKGASEGPSSAFCSRNIQSRLALRRLIS